MSWQHASPPSRTLCFKGAQGHSGRPVCTPTSAVRCRFRLLATLLLIGLLSSTNLHQTHPSATQLSYSRSRAPVCLRVLPVPERVPCQPYPCHCCFPSSPTRPLLLVFIQVYWAGLPVAYQCQRLVLCPLVTGKALSDLSSFSSSSAQSAQRHLPA